MCQILWTRRKIFHVTNEVFQAFESHVVSLSIINLSKTSHWSAQRVDGSILSSSQMIMSSALKKDI